MFQYLAEEYLAAQYLAAQHQSLNSREHVFERG